ncbi:DUF2271 domain-containing protein [Bordetella holmesii]|uniref:Periplasmic protein, PF10029 family n=2 Tax=Bordetella holmesii TaxID=35814 RepID=A0A158M4I8_9BORD|nr:DUF2271 domain-containing protein [Bordetella holmesii]AHV92428.1 hypothetical protein D560_2903 [Bordetella holmesii ATCC 51541]AIT27535.1 hypothetical protein D558_2879 [Bordetella holmesii 44057]EWM42426.1 hypothetical protein D556_2875 [Bordetella holmesii 41130]EWM48127.1 hypothetical protein D555_2923 [Bordetella holmesii 35009]EWM49108.1 hypothetical protein D557_2176 [Bordetella holmesii 70147]
MRKLLLSLVLAGAIARTAQAADLNVTVDIPRLDVAEYHRPYVAIWIERDDQSVAGDLAVWYDVAKKNNEGTEWLKDMRQWWRRSGRNQQFPVDGVSAATRPAGRHELAFTDKSKPLADLKPGRYAVVVEAAREVGGRELLRLPFVWPPQSAARQTAKGEHELGDIAVQIKP